MQTKKLTCVICPRGCALEADVQDEKIVEVRGNFCKRGEKYAESEIFHAERMLTTTVLVERRPYMLPVRTRSAIPREKLLPCMEFIKKVKVKPPIAIHDVIVKNILDTGIDIIASASYL